MRLSSRELNSALKPVARVNTCAWLAKMPSLELGVRKRTACEKKRVHVRLCLRAGVKYDVLLQTGVCACVCVCEHCKVAATTRQPKGGEAGVGKRHRKRPRAGTLRATRPVTRTNNQWLATSAVATSYPRRPPEQAAVSMCVLCVP